MKPFLDWHPLFARTMTEATQMRIVSQQIFCFAFASCLVAFLSLVQWTDLSICFEQEALKLLDIFRETVESFIWFMEVDDILVLTKDYSNRCLALMQKRIGNQ